MSQARILELRALIRKCNIDYYANDKPSVSDAEFDGLMRELTELEKQFPEYDRC
jgi:DNA ligase (NAD+)